MSVRSLVKTVFGVLCVRNMYYDLSGAKIALMNWILLVSCS